MIGNEVIRVFSVDDHPLMHEGISALIDSQPDMRIVCDASCTREAVAKFQEHLPDVTLMDLRLQDGNGIDAMRKILAEFPAARVIILTMFEGDAEIRRALEAGACAYLLKTMPPKELVEIIRKVHRGKKHIPTEIAAQLAVHLGDEYLTERELEVLQLVSDGNRNRDIAVKLFISEETVKVHIKHIMDKLGAADRTQAVSTALRRGIIHLK